MNDLALAASIREKMGKEAQAVREQGNIPAVLYGHGIETKSLEVAEQPFLKLYRQAGESSLIDLTIKDASPLKVLIHDIQRDPVTDRVIHVDFYQVRMDEKLTAEVVLNFVGESPAVKEQSGILVKGMNTVEIRCLPKDLIHQLDIDISALKTFDDMIHVKDLKFSEGIEVLSDPGNAIALVTPPRSEAEISALNEQVTEDVEKVEVSGKKKEEEPAEGEAPAAGAKEPSDKPKASKE